MMPAFSQSFQYNGPVTIPDASCGNGYDDPGETFPLIVSGVGLLGPQIARIDSVVLNITITWDSDLNIWLESPTGQVLELSTGNGGSADNYVNTIFKDDAPIFITTGAAPFTGNFKPEGRYNVLINGPDNTPAEGTYTIANTFNGNNADGSWKLRICDSAGGDIGTLQNWSIHFTKLCSTFSDDAGVINLTEPTGTFCSGSQSVNAVIKNFGNDTITSASVNWSVNGTLQTPVTFSGVLDTCVSSNAIDTVTLGTFNFVAGQFYQIKTWTSQPNGVPDPNNSNDTLTVIKAPGLAGAYTIGGASPNFNNFTEAVNALTLYGVCDSVKFNVRNGTYNEQISIGQIAGGLTQTRHLPVRSGRQFAGHTHIFRQFHE